ncbi:MAG: xanthine dehydrogenase family protein molybdopterin-binding subunit [Firmicutes bacterium]|nr:xanthine dehydrogenase family protein molybdopterin-binding subunit [Bacillota bacterium]
MIGKVIRIKTSIADAIPRIEAWEKATGEAKYCGDLATPDELIARVLVSPHAHARIRSIDVRAAAAMPGVKAILTGEDFPILSGVLIEDRPPLAKERVRYAGEAVAVVVAADEAQADLALQAIRVDYAPLPFALTPSQALAAGAPILHEGLGEYKLAVEDVYPQPGTNIVSQYNMRKGDTAAAFSQCEVVMEQRYFLPPSDHLAMEVRTARASITGDGEVAVTTCSQAPHVVQEQIATCFDVPTGKVRVTVPYVGGSFGGKAPVTLELLAYMATKKVGGRPVRVVLPREQDMASAPCRLGLEAHIKLGASKNGVLKAAEITYHLDCGAYADIAPYMTMAMAANGTGPYNIENLACDAVSVYTNHTYATSFRGFGHESYLFCVERAMDALAKTCGMDPWEIRFRNAIRPGCLSPSQIECTASNLGDLPECLNKLKALSHWEEGRRIRVDGRTVRAKGIACLWKAVNPPSDAISGAVLTFNADGSVNVNTGVIEMGSGDKTRLAQMLADKLRMDIGMVHVAMSVDTRANPKHWKTVASLSEYLNGVALMRAAEDALSQIRSIAAQALHCAPEEVEIDDAKAHKRSNPKEFFHFKELVHGYKAPDGTSVGDPVLGRGGFMLKGLSPLEPGTGRGKLAPAWTVGAQVVEIEMDIFDYTYRILRAGTVMDIGAPINLKATTEMINGGVSMGLSLASREAFAYDAAGVTRTPNLRTYKLLHIGQEPEYRVDFVFTPQEDAPFGLRSFTEHGILGIPAALGNALSAALDREINSLPITAEALWKAAGGNV